MFFGPPFLVQKPPRASPGQVLKSRVQILDPGFKNGSLGPKTKNMRTEKPCRTPVSDLKMEPYGPSYGLKTLWGKPGQAEANKLISYCKTQAFQQKFY